MRGRSDGPPPAASRGERYVGCTVRIEFRAVVPVAPIKPLIAVWALLSGHFINGQDPAAAKTEQRCWVVRRRISCRKKVFNT